MTKRSNKIHKNFFQVDQNVYTAPSTVTTSPLRSSLQFSMFRGKFNSAISKARENKQQLQKIFLQKADENQRLQNSNIANVLNSWGDTLSIDVDHAKQWFQKGNPELPSTVQFQ